MVNQCIMVIKVQKILCVLFLEHSTPYLYGPAQEISALIVYAYM